VSVSVTSLSHEFPLPDHFCTKLAEVIDEVLTEYDLTGGEVAVVFTDDQYILSLNKKYRGKNVPTDVLAFSYLDAGNDGSNETGEFPVGDIYISLDRAREQAWQAAHSLEKEVLLLAVHGTLHLVGYDHFTEEEAGVMRKREEEIIKIFEHKFPGED